jgi:hypothetical protein
LFCLIAEMAVHLVSVSVSTPSSGPVDAGERSYWRTRGCWDVRRVISPGCTVRPSGIFTSLGSSPSRNALRCAQSGRSSSSKLDVQYIAVDITMFFCKRLENIWFIRDRETLHGFHMPRIQPTCQRHLSRGSLLLSLTPSPLNESSRTIRGPSCRRLDKQHPQRPPLPTFN